MIRVYVAIVRKFVNQDLTRMLGNVFFSQIESLTDGTVLTRTLLMHPAWTVSKIDWIKLDAQGQVSSWTSPLNPGPCHVGWPQDKAAQGTVSTSGYTKAKALPRTTTGRAVIDVCRCKQRRTRLCLLCLVLCIICIVALVLGIGIPFGLLLNKGFILCTLLQQSKLILQCGKIPQRWDQLQLQLTTMVSSMEISSSSYLFRYKLNTQW